MSGIERPENIMCKIRVFYKTSEGEDGWVEWDVSYEFDIAGTVKHLSCGGKRIVTTEHVDLV